MIKHIVMWDIRGDNADEKLANCLRVKKLFEDMAGEIPGMRTIEVGIENMILRDFLLKVL